MTDETIYAVAKSFRHIKAGDIVTRMLAGILPMNLTISHLDEKFIYCGGKEGWKFDRDTGFEVDEDIEGLVSFLIE